MPSMFAAAGDFLPSAVTTEIGSQITNIQTDVSSFVTTNMGTLFSIIGIFVALGLIWWVVKFFHRASRSA